MEEDEKRPRRVDLSVSQVLAGALAAMCGSLVASRLGLAGTVIGTFVFSVVATVLTAIYLHSMVRLKERAEAARIAALRD